MSPAVPSVITFSKNHCTIGTYIGASDLLAGSRTPSGFSAASFMFSDSDQFDGIGMCLVPTV